MLSRLPSKLHNMTKKIIIAIIVAFGAIQLLPITDRKETKADTAGDFLTVVQPGESVGKVLQAACYDCHSNQTEYPWYAELAPVSWWIDGHVEDGTKHLNFSEWTAYDAKKADHKLEECVEMLENGEMPLESYTWLHEGARLSPAQREELVSFFKELRQSQAL